MKSMIEYSRETGYNMGMEYCDAILYRVRRKPKQRRALGKPTSETQAVVNERNMKQNFKRILHANFLEGRDLYVTLTFREGENPATRVYVDGKTRDCRQCGIYSEEYALLENATQDEVLELIAYLNGRDDIDGIMVQMPLPPHMDAQAVLRAVRPDKDLDCVHPYNLGQLMLGQDAFQPCTPAGVMRLLDEYGVDPEGKTCVVVGRSSIVGKPLAMLMVQRNATVTISHTHTHNLKAKCRRADIQRPSPGISVASCQQWRPRLYKVRQGS